MVTADFDGDGIADLATSDTGSAVVAISLGNGDGTFRQSGTFPVPSSTPLRHGHSQSRQSGDATIRSTTLSTAYAGAQGSFAGEDQTNIALPASLAGAGIVNVALSVDGQKSNSVQIQIQCFLRWTLAVQME